MEEMQVLLERMNKIYQAEIAFLKEQNAELTKKEKSNCAEETTAKTIAELTDAKNK
jgi:hypothetical protein